MKAYNPDDFEYSKENTNYIKLECNKPVVLPAKLSDGHRCRFCNDYTRPFSYVRRRTGQTPDVDPNKSNPENKPKGEHHEKSMEKPKSGLLSGRDGGERKLDSMDPARVATENVSGRDDINSSGAAERVKEGTK